MASASVDSPSSPAPEGEKLISLSILQIVREKQQVNGLKNGNYIRYHHYCTRKLKKLRSKLELTLTTGGKFVKRDFTSVQNYFEQLTQLHAEKKTKIAVDTQLRSSQLLQLLVFQAERAWSHAMQLKQDIAQQDIKSKRHHHLRRLGKAVRLSAKLDKLCKESADKRTQLESEAYHAWMSGNVLLANKKWQEALEKFIQSRTIYDNLSKIGRAAIKEVYTQRVEEIDTSIRFCHYNISKGKGATSDLDIITLIDSSDDPALDLLKSKLQDVLEETRKTQAKTMDEIEWSGKRIAIENDKIRIALIQAESIKNEINNCKSVDAKFRLYDKLFIALSDCQKLIRDDLKTNVNKNDEKFIANMRILHAFLTTMQLERTIERNMLMVSNTIEKMNEDSEENKKKGGAKRSSPLDVVRLYEVVLQNISDLKEIPGVEDNEKLATQLDAKASLYKAARCFYLGKEHANSAQWKEAFALYERSEKLSEQSKPQLSKLNLKEEQNELLNIQKNLREAKCVAKAQYILTKAKQKQRDEDMFEQRTTTTTEKQAGAKEKVDILHRLDDFTIERKGKPFLVAFPPNFEAIPTKPTFFDIASNAVKYPDLSDKVAKKKWFGFW